MKNVLSSAPPANVRDRFATTAFWAAWVCILIFIYFQSGAWRLLNSPPAGNHTWASCDRASQAWMMYQGNGSLLFPATPSVIHDPSGIDAGEFPLIPMVVSLEYKLFGFHEYLYRYTTLMLSLAGAWFAARIARLLIRNPWLALAAATLWMFSPNHLYYTVGFLPDTVAITCFLAGISLSLHAGTSGKWMWTIAFTLAILLKFNMAILYVAWLAAGRISDKGVPKQPYGLGSLGIQLIPVLTGLAWMAWTWYLKSQYHGHIFTTSPRITADLLLSSTYVATFLRQHLKFLYPPVLAVTWLGIMIWQGIASIRKRERMGMATILGLLGWIAFFWIMGHLSPHHHYYHLILGPLIFFALLALARSVADKPYTRPVTAGVIGIMLVWGSGYLPSVMKETAFHIDGIHPGWYSMSGYLQAMKVPGDALVFSYSDASPNISLYLMRMRGMNGNIDYPDWYLVKCMQQCDYAVLTDPALFARAGFSPLMDSYLGEHSGLHLYKLSHGNVAPMP